MIVFMKSTPCLKLGHFGSKTRSLDQMLEKSISHSGWHSFMVYCVYTNEYTHYTILNTQHTFMLKKIEKISL